MALGKSKADLAAEYAFSFLLAIFKTTHFRITIPINGCSSFIYTKAWKHESESVKNINLDADVFVISSRALMIAQISAEKIDAESGNLVENLVSPNSHLVIRLYKQECNNGTCLEFLNVAGICLIFFQMHQIQHNLRWFDTRRW